MKNRTNERDLLRIIKGAMDLQDGILYETCLRTVEDYRNIKEDISYTDYLMGIKEEDERDRNR